MSAAAAAECESFYFLLSSSSRIILSALNSALRPLNRARHNRPCDTLATFYNFVVCVCCYKTSRDRITRPRRRRASSRILRPPPLCKSRLRNTAARYSIHLREICAATTAACCTLATTNEINIGAGMSGTHRFA